MKKIIILFIFILGLSSCGNYESSTLNIKTEKNNQKIILALGDSLTAGYNLDISDGFPFQLETILKNNDYNYKVINAGVSSDTSKNLLDRIELYDDLSVDIYLIGIGANDGLRKQNIEVLKENISNIISHIKKVNPNSKIITLGMQLPLNLGLSYSNDFKNAYKDISKENETYFFKFLLDDVALNKDLNLSDGIHPNKEGYKIISNNIYNFLEDNNLISK